MATIQEAIKRLRYVFTSEGADKVVSDQNRVGAAVVASTTTQTKAALDLDKQFSNLERRYNTQIRAQQDFEKVQRQVNAAVAQHPELMARGNAVLAQAATQYGQAGVAAKAFAAATSGVSGQLIALSAGAGPVGVFLSALGPWGVAAAVGIGAAEKALSSMSTAAHGLAQKSQELRSFSEVTGLTTAQVQALRSEASKFGVTSDEAQSAVQQFTARFNDLRVGQGELLTQIRRINPALADQMATATDAASAMTQFGQALQQTSNIFERNALVKAAAGRGGLRTAEFLAGLDVSKVTQGYVDAGKALDDKLIKKLAQLEIDIAKTSAKASQNIASIFAEPVLQAEKSFAEVFLDISEKAKNFKLSGDWSTFIEGLRIAQRNAMAPLFPGMDKKDPFAKGAQSFDESGMFVTANVPMPRSRPQEADPRYVANQLKDQVAAMGEAAGAAMKLDLAQKQLAISGKEAGLTAGQLARASGILNETFANQKLQANVAAMGSAATVTEQYTAKVSGLQLQLDKGEISQQAFNRALGGLQMDEAIRAQSDMVSALGDMATPMDQYRLKVMQLQQQLDQGRISQETFNRAILGANPVFKDLKDTSTEFAQTFVSGIQSGKSAVDALYASLDNVSKKMASKGIENLITGALSGDPAQMAAGGVQLAISFGIKALTGDHDAQKKRDEEQQKAWIAWQGAAKDLAAYLTKASGGSIGTVQDAVEEMRSEWVKLATMRADAIGDKNAGNTDPVLIQLHNAFTEFEKRTTEAFRKTFPDQVENYLKGFGPDSPFQQAQEQIQKVGDELKAFVADTSYAFGNFVAGQNTFTEAFGNAGYKVDQTLTQVQQAQQAAQHYALTLLDTKEPLTDVQQKTQAMAGTAKQLQQVLIDLGMSATDAASAIQDKLAGAMDALRVSTEQDIKRQIADAQGRGYLFDVGDKIKAASSARNDLSLVGGNTALADQLLSATVQQIIDQNRLVGDSYQELLTLYPELTGQVHAYSEALNTTLRSADELARASESLSDRMLSASIDTNTLEGALAKFNQDALREREAEIAAGGENINSLTAVQEQERFNIVKSFADKAAEEQQRAAQDAADAQKRAAEDMKNFFDNFARTIKQFVDGLRSSASSPLSPQARLSAAQSQYNTQLALAQGGDRDAMNGITGYANDLLDASKAFYASSSSFQSTFNTVVAQLTALPAQQDATAQIVGAINGTTTAVGTTTSTVGSLNNALGGNSSLLTRSTEVAAQTAAVRDALISAASRSDTVATNAASLRDYLFTAYTNAGNAATNADTMRANLFTAYTNAANLATNAGNAAGNFNNAALAANNAAGNAASLRDSLFFANLNADSVRNNTGSIAGNTHDADVNANTLAQNIGGANGGINTAVGAIGTVHGDLSNAAAPGVNALLTLMRDQLTNNQNQNITINSQSGSVTVNNNVLTALNKIVYNTYAISANTNSLVASSTQPGNTRIVGAFATGGVIPPFGLGLVSEHSPGGGQFIRAGSEPITVSPFAPANDNSAVVSELRQLRAQLASMEQRLIQAELGGAGMVVDALDDVAQETKTVAKAARRA